MRLRPITDIASTLTKHSLLSVVSDSLIGDFVAVYPLNEVKGKWQKRPSARPYQPRAHYTIKTLMFKTIANHKKVRNALSTRVSYIPTIIRRTWHSSYIVEFKTSNECNSRHVPIYTFIEH